MKKIVYSFFILIFSVAGIQAQNEVDALRYAQLNPVGTARFASMGGAFGALGGDISVLATNPAGLGLFRSSQATLTYGWNNHNITAQFFESNKAVDTYSNKPTNVGFVMAGVAEEQSDWKFINIGFSYTQLKNYDARFTLDAKNTNSSLLDWEAAKLNGGIIAEGNSSYYLSGALIYDTINHSYLNDYQDAGMGYNLEQIHQFYSSGYAGEYNFSVAGNYLDKIYFGGSIGLQQIRYEQTIMHSEVPNYNIALKYFDSYDYFTSKATGFNLKLGFIYKLNQMVRLGASIQTPTVFNVKEDAWTDVYTTYEQDGIIYDGVGEAPINTFNWEYYSPLITAGSVAFVFGNHGMLSVDYELINYSGMRISADDQLFDEENSNIQDFYKTSQNIKLGGEYRLGVLSLRGGFAYLGSPFESVTINSDAYTLVYSGGAGLVAGNAYFDIAYHYTSSNENYLMYNYSGSMVDLKQINSSFLLTLGIKF
jgi:hypothetical protein